LLEATRKHNPEAAVVFASTNKVYGKLESSNQACKETQPIDFHSPYGCSKGAADQYVRDYARCFHMNTVVLRQSCIYGAHQYGTEDQGWVAHFVHSILRGKPLTIYGDGKQVRDLLDARDLSELYEVAIETIAIPRGEIYNGGGAAPHVDDASRPPPPRRLHTQRCSAHGRAADARTRRGHVHDRAADRPAAVELCEIKDVEHVQHEVIAPAGGRHGQPAKSGE